MSHTMTVLLDYLTVLILYEIFLYWRMEKDEGHVPPVPLSGYITELLRSHH